MKNKERLRHVVVDPPPLTKRQEAREPLVEATTRWTMRDFEGVGCHLRGIPSRNGLQFSTMVKVHSSGLLELAVFLNSDNEWRLVVGSNLIFPSEESKTLARVCAQISAFVGGTSMSVHEKSLVPQTLDKIGDHIGPPFVGVELVGKKPIYLRSQTGTVSYLVIGRRDFPPHETRPKENWAYILVGAREGFGCSSPFMYEDDFAADRAKEDRDQIIIPCRGGVKIFGASARQAAEDLVLKKNALLPWGSPSRCDHHDGW